MLFHDRRHAGRLLAARLAHYRGRDDVLVLALPRGGAPVAAEIARSLGAPLDVFIVRKLGLPGQPELAMGAVATGGAVVLNHELVDRLELPDLVIREAARRELSVIEKQQQSFRGRRPPPEIRGRTIVLVDDGLATGSTMRAAIAAIKRQAPRRLVVAAPVGAAETCDELRREVDEFVSIACPEDFHAVGQWYEDFSQTTDAEVVSLLAQQPAVAASP
jgi:predicted phosphoribosyltransferase